VLQMAQLAGGGMVHPTQGSYPFFPSPMYQHAGQSFAYAPQATVRVCSSPPPCGAATVGVVPRMRISSNTGRVKEAY
jgi:hypothetical protein